ncbi:MAG: tetratricopeptide repeat protein [Gemmatimonadales bacterium]
MSYQFSSTTERPDPGPLAKLFAAFSAVMLFTVGLAIACNERTPEPIIAGETAVVETPAVAPRAASAPAPVTFSDGEIAFREKRYEDAVAIFTAYTASQPENAWGHYMLALSAWRAGEPERAVTEFEQALAIDSTHVKSLLNLSRVLLEQGRAEEALEHVSAALELDESDDAYRVLGRAKSELGDVEAAVEAYRQAIVLNERDPWNLNNLGYTLIQDGRFDEAIGPLALATEIDSTTAVFWNNLGMALERTGHRIQAVDAYRRAVGIDATYVKAQTNLTRVEGLAQDPAILPVDFEVEVAKFREKIDLWKAGVTDER